MHPPVPQAKDDELKFNYLGNIRAFSALFEHSLAAVNARCTAPTTQLQVWMGADEVHATVCQSGVKTEQ
jgi:hypothetical protein